MRMDDDLDWLGEDHDWFDSHVLRYYGCDLAAAGIWAHDIAPCLLCCPLSPRRDPAALCLTDEVLDWGRRIHFVACGNCGTRGPWADTESQALAQWNAAYTRHRVGRRRDRHRRAMR